MTSGLLSCAALTARAMDVAAAVGLALMTTWACDSAALASRISLTSLPSTTLPLPRMRLACLGWGLGSGLG